MKDERGIERAEIAGDLWDDVNRWEAEQEAAGDERIDAWENAPEQEPPTEEELEDHYRQWKARQ